MTPVRLTIDPKAFESDHADPDLAELNREIIAEQKKMPDLWSMPVDRVRYLRKQGHSVFPAPQVDRDSFWLRHYGSAGRSIDVRVTRPSNGATRGTYLYLHGGGWVFGGADETDARARRLAENTGLTVCSVDYRLAPEHPFPAAIDDCVDIAVTLAAGNLNDLPRGFLAIGGESAGAHLAVLTLIRLRDEFGVTSYRAANLVAGCYDLSLTPSVRRFSEERLILNTSDVQEFVLRFVPDETQSLRDPAISPLYADLTNLPPAFFSGGTADLLIDDTLFMATRWATAGNRTELDVTPGGCHVFQAFGTDASRRSLDDQEDFLRRIMASPL